MLNEYEAKKFATIEKLVRGGITRKEAACELNLSLRQIDRLKKSILPLVKTDLFTKVEVRLLIIKRYT